MNQRRITRACLGRLGLWVALTLLYFGAAKFGLRFATVQENVTLVWPPTGIALAALLLFGYDLWPGVALGAFLANVTTDVSLPAAVGIGIGNTLEALTGAFLLKRLSGFQNSLKRLRDVFGLVLLAAGLSTLVSATLGAASLCWSGAAPWTAYGVIWRVWWLGDFMGALLIAPVLLTWGERSSVSPQPQTWIEAIIMLLSILAVGLVVFSGRLAYPYLLFPLIIWAALRFGQRGVASATLLVAGLAVWSMTRGLGPFSGATLDESLNLFATFITVISVTGMLLGAVMGERQSVEAALRASEQRYRALLAAEQRQAQELALLDKVRTALAHELDLPAVFRTVVEALAQAAGYSQVSLYLLEGETLVLQHQKGYARVIERIPVTQGIAGRVARTGQPVLLEDVRTDPTFLGAIEGIVSEVCVPLHNQARVVGVLNVESTQGVALSRQDLSFLLALGGQISIAIRRAALFTEVRESEVKHRLLLNSVRSPVLAVGADLDIRYCNEAYAQFVGRPISELEGQNLLELFPEFAQTQSYTAYQEVLHTGEMRQVAGKLRERYLQAQVYPTPWGVLSIAEDVTERRAAEAARQASETKLRAIIDNATEAIFLKDRQGRYLLVNPAVATLFQLPMEAILGRTDVELFGPETAHATMAVDQQVMETGRPQTYERERLFGSERRILKNTKMPFRSPQGDVIGLIGIGHDITAQKRAEMELRESRELFFRAFEYAPIGMALVLPDHSIARTNKAYAEMLGYSPTELQGHYFRDLTHPEDVGLSLDSHQQLVAGALEHYRFEKRYRHAQGSFIWAALSVSAVRDADGALLYAIAQIQDITERIQADEAIRKLNEDLEKRVAERTVELEAAVREIEDFSYTVSHDLRAPLRAVNGFAALLRDEHAAHLSHQAQTHLQRIRENALHMSHLIDSLLEFIRLNRQPLHRQLVQPAELVRQVLDQLRAGPETDRATITLAELPACQADPALLKRVWHILLENAFKFTRPRGTPRIDIGCQTTEAGELIYFVRDNGVGFDMQYAHKLFRVFQRLHRVEDYAGLGAGLALAQRIIHRHGGRLWAAAEVDHGATFFFTL